MSEPRGHWRSNTGFILAATGSAIGLGNLWKFPFITWENNGGAFVLVYLVCIAAVGLPIMMAELRRRARGRLPQWARTGGVATSDQPAIADLQALQAVSVPPPQLILQALLILRRRILEGPQGDLPRGEAGEVQPADGPAPLAVRVAQTFGVGRSPAPMQHAAARSTASRDRAGDAKERGRGAQGGHGPGVGLRWPLGCVLRISSAQLLHGDRGLVALLLRQVHGLDGRWIPGGCLDGRSVR